MGGGLESVPPEGSARGRVESPAGVHLHHFAALFALDVAAPVELTAAAVHHLHLLRVEAPATAHQLAAVNGLGGFVAVAAGRSQHARRARVKVTEVRAGLQVDQILICVRFELGVARHQDLGGANLPLLHLSGAVELLLDDVAHLPEGWHGLPAGLELTGA